MIFREDGYFDVTERQWTNSVELDNLPAGVTGQDNGLARSTDKGNSCYSAVNVEPAGVAEGWSETGGAFTVNLRT